MNRIAKIYIWLLPILSVPVLFLVKSNFDRSIFIIAVGVHLLFIALSLGVLVRPSQIVIQSSEQSGRLTAILLIAGATLTFIAATTFSGTALTSMSVNKFEHYWTSGGFLFATLVSLAGALFLLLNFREKFTLPLLSFTMLLIGTVLWIIHLAFRLTVMIWAAEHALGDDVVLKTYAMINSLSVSLYASYMVLSYLAFAGFSVALWKSNLLKGWLVKFCSAFGLISPLLFASGVSAFGMPITAQLIPFLIGVQLIDSRGAFKSKSSS